MTLDDFAFDEDPSVVPDEWWWARIRVWRDTELSLSDWTQLPDTPVDAGLWAAYRQALRDMTLAATPADVTFPDRPA